MKPENKCALQLPKDKEIIESPTAHLWIDDDGILNSISKEGARTMAGVKETIRVIKEMTGGEKICYLADTSNATYYTIEMRNELSNNIHTSFKAVALVPCTETGKVMGSILFMRKKPCPIKFFEDIDEAKAWLKGFL